MDTRLRARLLAFITHLITSAGIITAFSLFVYLIWYPSPYHIIHSTLDVIKNLVLVDVVLGPILTLVLFDIRKPHKELRRDISIVVLIQLAALVWGGHITYKMRPLVAAYYENTFFTVTREDLDPADLNHDMLPAFYETPRLVYVMPIKDKEERQKHFSKVLSLEEKPLMLQPFHYADLDTFYADLHDAGRLDMDRVSSEPEKLQKLKAFWIEHQGKAEDYCYHQVMSGPFVGTLVMDCEEPVIVGLINGRL